MKRFYLAAVVIGAIFFFGVGAQAETDPHRVARQLREYFMGESTAHGERLLDDVELPKTSVTAAMRLVGQLKEDGSWADIDYTSGDRAAWPAFGQLTRTLSIVVQARRANVSPEDAAKCIAAVHRSLGYWAKHDFQCPNWWYNQIGVPKTMGQIALLMDSDLAPDERNYILNVVMARSKVGTMTGQNRTWLAGIGVMRAAAMNDDALLGQAADVIRGEVRVTTDEGLQPDWSFHQHGPQQQFGNYGMSYAVEMTRWATVLRDTRYAFDGLELGIIRNYLHNGQAWVCWRGTMDISSCGRQLEPGSPRGKASTMMGVMRGMTVVDPQNAESYRRFVSRNHDGALNDLSGNCCFWRSDYLIHRRPEWMASLKMHSVRTIGGETVNSENLSGLHLADGATFFYRSGHEYDDIFPVLEWRQIPGTTCVQDDSPLVWPKKPDAATRTEFVGGTGDGANGCAAMDFHGGEVQAKKAWFFCGDTVACLGAGISSSAAEPVVTGVNQCLLHGDVAVNRAGVTKKMARVSAKFSDAGWVEQDGFRYVFPSPMTIEIDAGSRTGNWKTVFTTASTPKADVTKDVFNLRIDHGSRPHDAQYAYFVTPAGVTDSRVQILSNTVALQAIQAEDHWAGAVFWVPGSAMLRGQKVTVDEPCILMVGWDVEGTSHITVADPTQKLKTVNIRIGEDLKPVELPQGGKAGSSVSLPANEFSKPK